MLPDKGMLLCGPDDTCGCGDGLQPGYRAYCCSVTTATGHRCSRCWLVALKIYWLSEGLDMLQ